MREREYRAAMLLECLGEPNRFQILRWLESRPRGVSELARLMKRSLPTVCHHLAVLRMMHLVRFRNRGVNTFYELKAPVVLDLLRAAVDIAPKLALTDADANRS